MSGAANADPTQNDGGALPLDRLIRILEQPEDRIFPLLHSSLEEGSIGHSRKETLRDLVEIAKDLFRGIDELGAEFSKLSRNRNLGAVGSEEDGEMHDESLSGLSQLFLPSDIPVTDTDLPETIYGQVDLQNVALMTLIRKSTKRLGKSRENVRLLDIGDVSEEEEEEEEENDMQDDRTAGEDDEKDLFDEGHESDSENSMENESKKIEERMLRAMQDMEAEDQNHSLREEVSFNALPSQKEGNALFDPVAEDLKDGFFDLNDMESFADEEEDLLPGGTLGQGPDTKERRRHVDRLEDDDDESHQDSEEDDNDSTPERELSGNKRKKYRDDDEINALHSLYESNMSDGDTNADAANMTAAEFFGSPNTKFMERYKKRRNESTVDGIFVDEKMETDSWDDHDFENLRSNAVEETKGSGSEKNKSRVRQDNTKSGKIQDKNAKGLQIHRQTEELENELLSEKPWQMIGESKASSRPINSLLESTPEFDMAGKQAPVITIEHTRDLEDVIKKRILAEDWDDVVPRELPDIGRHIRRDDAPEISQEKSKLGLGELYEREYLKKTTGYDKDGAEKSTQEEKAKEEMKSLFANLCSKLDALSNYHFAPRPIADEAEVQPVSTPAIAMEEVLPLYVNDGRGSAPEEVYASKRGREGILQSALETDASDRKKLRRTKKASRRKARKEKHAEQKLVSRLEPGLGLNNPFEKRRAEEEMRVARSKGRLTDAKGDGNVRFGSSNVFFRKMQGDGQDLSESAAGNAPHKSIPGASSSFKLG
ncbi:Mpp10 domain containing protein [Nitzschia inconspicua]|uniref:U3 small nucleolar ribonucleoprotein protein MPP10 n=1 Tax=Nitzschia inconspicua TaxID=303405 RepID=A0A9K3LG06_9STRA|nr:Mpp10 domain containing protein [Nitzschia inconspicua]